MGQFYIKSSGGDRKDFQVWVVNSTGMKKQEVKEEENDNSLGTQACPEKAADRIGTLNSTAWICLFDLMPGKSSKNVLPSGGLILMKSHGTIRKILPTKTNASETKRIR